MCQDLETLDVDGLPAGVRVVSLDYVNGLPQTVKKTSSHRVADGEGYTDQGLRFGQGWVERVAGRATGILEIQARLPDLEHAQEQAKSRLADVEAEFSRLQELRDQAVIELKSTSESLAALEKQSVQLSHRLAGLHAKNQEVEASRLRLQREKQSLIDAQSQIDKERDELDQQLDEITRLRQSIQDQLTPMHQRLDAYKASLGRLRDERNQLMLLRSDLRVEVERLSGIESRSQTQVERIEGQLASLVDELESLATHRHTLSDRPAVTDADLKAAVSESQRLEQALQVARQSLGEREECLRQLETERAGLERDREVQHQALNERRLKEQAIEIELSRLQQELNNRQANEAHLIEIEQRFEGREAAESELNRIETRIERLGPINLVALDEYQKELERKAELDHQHAELTEALETLEDAIRKIDRETRALFRNTFDAINQSFGEIFPQLFGGGEAWLMLTDEDLLFTGVTIMARPPGKRNSSIYLLSGGEKALTALSLVFAIFHLNPAPFCLLDEVDAPLDDANVGRYADAVAKMSNAVQFIYITHNKIAMERAEQLMGVTMSESGVSRLVSVDIDRAVELATTE